MTNTTAPAEAFALLRKKNDTFVKAHVDLFSAINYVMNLLVKGNNIREVSARVAREAGVDVEEVRASYLRGRALNRLPATKAAFERGDISRPQADTIARKCAKLTEEEVSAVEEKLVDLAPTTSSSRAFVREVTEAIVEAVPRLTEGKEAPRKPNVRRRAQFRVNQAQEEGHLSLTGPAREMSVLNRLLLDAARRKYHHKPFAPVSASELYGIAVNFLSSTLTIGESDTVEIFRTVRGESTIVDHLRKIVNERLGKQPIVHLFDLAA
jgi:hypothetical protein